MGRGSANTFEPEEPFSTVKTVIMAIVYVIGAVICVLSLTTNLIAGVLGGIIKSLNEESLQALAKLYGYMLLALMPSAIIFIANRAPVAMTMFLRVLLWIIGVLGMGGLLYLFFRISARPEYAELLGNKARNLYGLVWLRTSAIVSVLGVIVINVMANFWPNFNISNGLGSFCDTVWAFTQGHITSILFMLLTFLVLPWTFLVLPLSGVYIFVLIITLIAICDS